MWIVYALLAAVVWGLDYSISEQILKNKVSPLVLITVQMLIGGFIFLPFAVRSYLKSDSYVLFTHHKVVFLLLVAIITFNLGNFLIFLSVQAKNATLTGLIELCYPLCIAMFTWLLFGENQITRGVIIGGILIISGVLAIYFIH